MKQRYFPRRDVRRRTVSCRPHCEVLEARLPLGDVLLGTLWASSLGTASMSGGEGGPVKAGLTVLASEDLALTSVEWNSSFRPEVALQTAKTEELATGETRDIEPMADFVAVPMRTTAPVRAMGSLQVWHAFAPSASGTAPDQGGAKAWHPWHPAFPGSQALPGNPMPGGSAANPRGGASHAVRSQAEPGNEVVERYGNTPLTFEANHGQTDARVDFITRAGGGTVFLTPTSAVFSFQQPALEPRSRVGLASASRAEPEPTPTRRASEGEAPGVARHMNIVGANPNASPVGEQRQPGIVNYFLGNDPSAWHTNIPTFDRVQYQDVYPGIDLAYYGGQSPDREGAGLEYDFIVSPGADPNQIALTFSGADSVEIDANGDLVLQTGDTELRQQKPYIYQEVNGQRQEVAGEFRIQTSESLHNSSFILHPCPPNACPSTLKTTIPAAR